MKLTENQKEILEIKNTVPQNNAFDSRLDMAKKIISKLEDISVKLPKL